MKIHSSLGKVFLSFLLVFCFPVCLSLSGQTATIADDLEQQIQSLIGIEQALSSYNAQMETLRGQMLSLTNQLDASQSESQELLNKLALSQIALQAYQGKVATVLSNYEGLLTLSKQYKAGLETWRTAFWISTGVLSASIIIILITR
jgi:septal ring factor EnvC (AmiA/AmiB activator)